MFNKLRKILSKEGINTPEYQQIFNNVIGYHDIKLLLHKMITSKYTNSVLLIGPPASSKTVFILGLLPSTKYALAFLVTILPFVHGAILMFSSQWYKDNSGKAHFRLAFVFFIAVFLQTVLLYYAAVYVEEASLFILFLWLLMIVNIGWLLLQGLITYRVLGRNDYFLYRWIPINFNTAAFLSVFLFIYPNVFSGQVIDNNHLINLLILTVLIARSISDYYLAWKDLYNKISSTTSHVSRVFLKL